MDYGRHVASAILAHFIAGNDIAPNMLQAITWANAGLFLISSAWNDIKSNDINNVHARKLIWKCRLQNGGHLVSVSTFVFSVLDSICPFWKLTSIFVILFNGLAKLRGN